MYFTVCISVFQVYDTRISFFVNGLEQDGTPFETQDLLGQIVDSSNAQVRIGQRISGQFIINPL